MQDSLCDILESTRSECGWPLRRAMEQINHEGEGVVVILRNQDNARDIVQRIQNCHLADTERRSQEAGETHETELRTFGVGAQILTDLGIHKMRVMSAPKNLHALAGFHLEVTEFVEFE